MTCDYGHSRISDSLVVFVAKLPEVPSYVKYEGFCSESDQAFNQTVLVYQKRTCSAGHRCHWLPCSGFQGPILLSWFNLNPSTDK